MTQYEMTGTLAEKCEVSLEEARNALEKGGWNELTATHLLEQEKFRRMQALHEFAGEAAAVQFAPEQAAADEAAEAPEAAQSAAEAETTERIGTAARAESKKHDPKLGLKKLFGHARRLVACGNRNRLVVSKGGETALELPVTALVILMLCAFWVCMPLLVIGLFAGCRYSFAGKELGREGINHALDKAADAAGRVKQSVAKA